jgi:hypothetical protein
MAALFEITYGNSAKLKLIGIILIFLWGFAIYYATLPNTGLIKFDTLDNYPFLRETSHFLMFMVGFMVLGPLVINMVPVGSAASGFGRR